MHIQGLSAQQYFSGLAIARPGEGAAPAPVQTRSTLAFAVAPKNESPADEESFDLYGADARMLKTLKDRDQAVRDQARDAGAPVGGRQFVYQTGPDGRQYAVGALPGVSRREGSAENGGAAASGGPVNQTGAKMDADDEALLQKLQSRDAKVRSHELAHMMAAGGQAAGLPEYTYQTGPDGRQYAVGGAVNISISSTGDAQHDAGQAETARRAALATGEPSIRDALTAAQAGDMAARARQRGLKAYGQAGQDAYAQAGQGASPSDISLTA